MRPRSAAYRPATKRATTALVMTPWVTLTHASAACEHRRLMQVDSRVGEHLVGHLAAAGRVGEVGEPVAAQAASERQQRGGLRLTVRRALAWRAAARQQVLADRVGRLERGRR